MTHMTHNSTHAHITDINPSRTDDATYITKLDVLRNKCVVIFASTVCGTAKQHLRADLWRRLFQHVSLHRAIQNVCQGLPLGYEKLPVKQRCSTPYQVWRDESEDCASCLNSATVLNTFSRMSDTVNAMLHPRKTST